MTSSSRNSIDKHVWAPRVFWLLFGVFAINALSSVLYAAFAVVVHSFGPANGMPSNGTFATLDIFTRRLPIFLAGYYLIRGAPRFVNAFLASRARLTVFCGMLFLFDIILECFDLLVMRDLPSNFLTNEGFVFNLIASSLYSLCLIAPMIWLVPSVTSQKKSPTNPNSQNQGSFNLEQAVAAWRAELARQPGLIPSDLKELEAHLRDAFAELSKNKLGDAEAFLLAQRRIGAPASVAAEFAKAAPRRIWSRRLFWLAFGLFSSNVWVHAFPWLWTYGLNLLPTYFDHGQFSGPATWIWPRYIPMVIVRMDLPIFIAAYWLVRGVPQFVSKRLTTRTQVAAVGAGMFVLANMHLLYVLTGFLNPWFVVDGDDYLMSIFNDEPLWQLTLLALMIWLTPGRAKTKSQPTLA